MAEAVQQTHAVALLRQLENAGAMTATSLTLSDPKISFERYEALGAFLGEVNKSCAFWIGDWLVFGEQVFGERVAQAAEATGLAPQTLANRMSVCRHIPPEHRRASLAFGTHAEVAYLQPKERNHWLDKAEKSGWTRANLREAMRASRLDATSDEDIAGRSVLPGIQGSLSKTTAVIPVPDLTHSEQIAWAAGFLEGEGSFFMNNSPRGSTPTVKATQTDPECLERLRAMFGGSIQKDERPSRLENGPDGTKRRPLFEWRISGQKALEVMLTVSPQMSTRRRDQIERCVPGV